MKTDYWTCEQCGSDFGPDQSDCPDPYCIEKKNDEEARAIQDQIEEDRGREIRAGILTVEYFDE